MPPPPLGAASTSTGPERYTCCEALFNPHIYGTDVKAKRGLHATAIESIKKCDADITGLLYGNVVLSGGTSMFRGMQDRVCTALH